MQPVNSYYNGQIFKDLKNAGHEQQICQSNGSHECNNCGQKCRTQRGLQQHIECYCEFTPIAERKINKRRNYAPGGIYYKHPSSQQNAGFQAHAGVRATGFSGPAQFNEPAHRISPIKETENIRPEYNGFWGEQPKQQQQQQSNQQQPEYTGTLTQPQGQYLGGYPPQPPQQE